MYSTNGRISTEAKSEDDAATTRPKGTAGQIPKQQKHTNTHQRADGAEKEQGDGVRESILSAALEHVPTLGWSMEALQAGAADLRLSPASTSVFPRGAVELVEYFVHDCNRRLRQKFEDNNDFIKDMRTVDKIKTAARLRLQMIVPVVDHWPQALALMAMPQNVPYSLNNFGLMLDEVWHLSGDRATDWSWYTKRATLAAAYGASELYLLTDQSPDKAQTWDFLHRCIDNALSLATCPAEVKNTVQTAIDIATRAFWPPSKK